MKFFDKFLLPSSMSYSEIIFNISEDRIGYCYSGTSNKGSLMIKQNGEIKIIKSDITEERETIDSFEMWTFIDEIEDGLIRQKAVNKFFEVYLNYNGHMKLEDIEYRL